MTFKGKGPVQYLNRERKARMVDAFLKDALGVRVENQKILDIGCGNGQICQYFGGRNNVTGVDVEDKRTDKNTEYLFQKITNEKLPFDDRSFDIVISHHVIEHVVDQKKHLSEISRVLKKGGLAYLGCPNGGSPFMAGHKGNDQVPAWKEITALFDSVGLAYEEYYTRLLAYPKKYHCELTVGQYIPSSLIRLFRCWYPGHCFILRHKNARS